MPLNEKIPFGKFSAIRGNFAQSLSLIFNFGGVTCEEKFSNFHLEEFFIQQNVFQHHTLNTQNFRPTIFRISNIVAETIQFYAILFYESPEISLKN